MVLYKLYLIVSAEAIKNMNGNRGRMVTQSGHGWVHSIWDSMNRFPDDVKAYKEQGSAFKITLVVPDSEALKRLYDTYKNVCGASLVEEHGNKVNGEINEQVKGITCLGIGPIRSNLIGDDLQSLKPFL
jgi:peptidyl-tRNA hydrolase